MVATTQSGVIPLVQGLMEKFPGAPKQLFLQLKENLDRAGSDQNAISSAVDRFALAVQPEAMPQQAAAGTVEDPATLAPVPVVGKREPPPPVDYSKYALGAPLNTDLASPYTGTTQEAANPANPGASGMSQFDPVQLKAAQAAQAQKYQDTMANKAITGGIAGAAAGFTDGRSVDQNAARWKIQDEQNMLETLGAQKALQEQATAGTENATKMQTMAKTAGEYQGTQQAKQQELVKGELGKDAQLRLNQAGTPESLLAVMMLTNQMKSAGLGGLPKGLDPKTLTAQQVMGFMDPKVLEAYKTKIGIQATQAETAQKQLGTKIASNITKDGTVIPAGNNMSFTGGGITFSPNQQVTTEQAAVGTRSAQTENQISNFDTLVEPVIKTTMKNLQNTYTGKGASSYAKFMPGDNNQVAVAQQFARINQYYPEALPPEIAASIRSQSSQPGWNGELKIELDPSQAFQALASSMANVARIKADRKARVDFQKGGGNPIEYSVSDVAKSNANKLAVINPKTFKVTLVDRDNPNDMKMVQEQGLEPADSFKIGK
jgi:hypothetical protein